MPPPVPVTVLSGFLGAGKTTVLTRLLATLTGRRLAVLVNDMSAVNIDEELVREAGMSVAHVQPEMVALSNGCICCTLRIEFADVILLTKTDLVAPDHVARVRAVVGALNHGARILECVHGSVPVGEILGTGRFSLERARAHAGWLRELRGEHRPETEEYGISSFVYTANRPFDHDRLVDLMRHGRLKGVLRSKGFVWSTHDPGRALAWSQAGAVFSLSAVRTWKLREDGTPAGGQRLVFIGMHMDEARLRRRLDAMLVQTVPTDAAAPAATVAH